MNITVSKETIRFLVKFKIRGNLRFLSHAETINLFQRACVRAGIKTQYSEGFNPRPRLSLPLPRSVGVESEDDLLCIRVEADEVGLDSEQLKLRLGGEVPAGCELVEVTVSNRKISLQPRSATYLFLVRQGYFDERLKERIEHLLASESLNLERRIEDVFERGGEVRSRLLDVRPFVKSIRFDDGVRGFGDGNQQGGTSISVECEITPGGTIRVDEIMSLLGLDHEMLAGPVRRTRIEWQ